MKKTIKQLDCVLVPSSYLRAQEKTMANSVTKEEKQTLQLWTGGANLGDKGVHLDRQAARKLRRTIDKFLDDAEEVAELAKEEQVKKLNQYTDLFNKFKAADNSIIKAEAAIEFLESVTVDSFSEVFGCWACDAWLEPDGTCTEECEGNQLDGLAEDSNSCCTD